MAVDDYRTYAGRRPGSESIDWRAVVQAPLLYHGEIIGTLAVSRIADDRKFMEADLRLLSLLASLAAGAVHNARLLEETTQRAQRQAALYRISTKTLVQLSDRHELCQAVVSAPREILHYPFIWESSS